MRKHDYLGKKFFLTALVLALMAVCVASALAGDKPITADMRLPLLATCTAENVRLRDKPTTKGSKIYGVAEAYRNYVVVDRARDKSGDTWLKLDNPDGGPGDTFWIFGKYMRTALGYPENLNGLMGWLYHAIGSTPVRTRATLGPTVSQRTEREKFNVDGEEGSFDAIIMTWKNLEVRYTEWEDGAANLNRVHLTGPSVVDMSDAPVQLGDPISKVTKLFGAGDNSGASGVTIEYTLNDFEQISFHYDRDTKAVTAIEFSRNEIL